MGQPVNQDIVLSVIAEYTKWQFRKEGGVSMQNVLISDEKYSGKYVIIKSLDDPLIISSGSDPKAVYDEAARKGYKEFLLLFVPEKELVHIYETSVWI